MPPIYVPKAACGTIPPRANGITALIMLAEELAPRAAVFAISAAVFAAVAEISAEAVVDVNTVTEGHNEWFTVDGTHPNEDGARAIAQAVYRVVSEIE